GGRGAKPTAGASRASQLRLHRSSSAAASPLATALSASVMRARPALPAEGTARATAGAVTSGGPSAMGAAAPAIPAGSAAPRPARPGGVGGAGAPGGGGSATTGATG